MTHKNSDARKTHSRSLMAAALVATAGLAGCASLSSGGAPETIIEQRSEAYWKARAVGDTAKAYSFMTPGYRALHDLRKYEIAYGAVPDLRDPQLLSIQCDGAPEVQPQDLQRCVLRKKFSTGMPLGVKNKGRIPIVLSETWIKEEGQWWLYLR